MATKLSCSSLVTAHSHLFCGHCINISSTTDSTSITAFEMRMRERGPSGFPWLESGKLFRLHLQTWEILMDGWAWADLGLGAV